MRMLSFVEMEEGVYRVFDDYGDRFAPFLIIRQTANGKTLQWSMNVGDTSGYVQNVRDYPNERHNAIRLTALAKRVYGFK